VNRGVAVLTLGLLAMTASPAAAEKAVFAGGCFWCMEPGFDRLDGVSATIVGYTGGAAETANYDAVSSGKTGHVEAIEITYDPARVSYAQLLHVYWQNIDPFDPNGQFADKGSHYQTVIFYGTDAEKLAAENSKAAIEKEFGKTAYTRIEPRQPFFAAEAYHQDYYQKNEGHYTRYKYGSGRVKRLEELWGADKH